MKLSIIVPMFNVEKYIARCLDSILSQNISYDDYEIIVVNDGCQDQSAKIVKEYQKKYENITLIEKENGGLSSARNAGLSNCKGKYIWMIDSDDSIKENCLEDLLNYAFQYDIDFLSFPMNDIFDNKRVVLSNFKNKPSNIVVTNFNYIQNYRVEYSACCFIIKNKVIKDNNLRFIEGILHEDIDFVIRLLEFSYRVSSFQSLGGLYNYYVGRPQSITTIKSKQKYLKSLESFYISIKELQEKYSYADDYSRFAQVLINNMKCYALSYLLYYPLSYKEREVFFNKYKDIDAYNIGKTSYISWKLRLLKIIYSSPFIFKNLIKLVSKVRN